MDENERNEELVGQILEITGSPQSQDFYLQAIQQHGVDRVRLELHELRSQILTKEGTPDAIRNPAAFFTFLLKNLNESNPDKIAKSVKPISGKSVFFDSTDQLISDLVKNEAPICPDDYNGAMVDPFSKKGIPWPTFIGHDFFTLPTNKLKSDKVMTHIRLNDGRSVPIPMVRGKGYSQDSEHGIATTDDGRVLKALSYLWVEGGAKYTTGEVQKCFADFSIRNLARKLRYKKFGGSDLGSLLRKLDHISDLRNYIDVAGTPGFEDYIKRRLTVDFIDKPQVLESQRKHGTSAIVVRIRFSEFFSRQLLNRKVILKSKTMMVQKNDLAFLLQEYIESRVEEGDRDGFSIGLKVLIKKLNLPPAKWHKYKSQRRNVFEKSLKALNEATTWQGDSFNAAFKENKDGSDFLLNVFRLAVVETKPGSSSYGLKVRAGFVAEDGPIYLFGSPEERCEAFLVLKNQLKTIAYLLGDEHEQGRPA